MVWGKAGTTTLTSAGNDMNITMTSNKFSQVLSHHSAESGAIGNWTTFNDTGSVTQTDKYVRRQSIDGGTDSASYGSEDASPWQYGGTKDEFVIADVFATSGEEILFITHVINAGNTGVSTGATPHRNQLVGKSTISAPVTRIDFASGSNNFGVSSNLSVLGSDIAGSSAVPAIPALVKSLQSPSVGGWKEIARTTLGSTGDTISVASLADKRYYMVLGNHLPSGNFRTTYRINNDSGSNYALRKSEDGNAENVTTSITDITSGNKDEATQYFDVSYLSNLSDQEKLIINHNMRGNTAGASNAPSRVEAVSKWANTSSVINRIDAINDQGGDYAIGSEVVVLGWDPADTHTTNFWEQLATASGAGSTLDTGTFTAKKYLWVQGYCKPTSSSNIRLNFNSDVSGNYAIRESINGGNDTLNTQQASSDNLTGTSTGGLFFNMFIVNNAGSEKLWISHGQENADGVGTAGDRKEMVGKWTNTSDAITKITCYSNFGATSELRVWGSD